MDITLGDTTANGPIYDQVRTQIATRIESGALASGTPLPNPATLARDLNVDRGEVSRAYFELEQSGLVVVKKSKNFLGETTTNYSVR